MTWGDGWGVLDLGKPICQPKGFRLYFILYYVFFALFALGNFKQFVKTMAPTEVVWLPMIIITILQFAIGWKKNFIYTKISSRLSADIRFGNNIALNEYFISNQTAIVNYYNQNDSAYGDYPNDVTNRAILWSNFFFVFLPPLVLTQIMALARTFTVIGRLEISLARMIVDTGRWATIVFFIFMLGLVPMFSIFRSKIMPWMFMAFPGTCNFEGLLSQSTDNYISMFFTVWWMLISDSGDFPGEVKTCFIQAQICNPLLVIYSMAIGLLLLITIFVVIFVLFTLLIAMFTTSYGKISRKNISFVNRKK